MGGCGREGAKLLGPDVVRPFPPALHWPWNFTSVPNSLQSKPRLAIG